MRWADNSAGCRSFDFHAKLDSDPDPDPLAYPPGCPSRDHGADNHWQQLPGDRLSESCRLEQPIQRAAGGWILRRRQCEGVCEHSQQRIAANCCESGSLEAGHVGRITSRRLECRPAQRSRVAAALYAAFAGTMHLGMGRL
jgi:hypothetical protein